MTDRKRIQIKPRTRIKVEPRSDFPSTEKNQRKTTTALVGRGGPGRGQGRKKGSLTKKTREIAHAAMKAGVTPLEYMLRVLREPDVVQQEGEPDNVFHSRVLSQRSARMEAAKASAPYIHPKLASSSVELYTKSETTEQTSELPTTPGEVAAAYRSVMG